MDIRSKKLDLVAQSEDQEDELLSIVAIKGFVNFLSFNLTLKRQICGWIIPDKGVDMRPNGKGAVFGGCDNLS